MDHPFNYKNTVLTASMIKEVFESTRSERDADLDPSDLDRFRQVYPDGLVLPCYPETEASDFSLTAWDVWRDVLLTPSARKAVEDFEDVVLWYPPKEYARVASGLLLALLNDPRNRVEVEEGSRPEDEAPLSAPRWFA